jgi:hypothetical protein
VKGIEVTETSRTYTLPPETVKPVPSSTGPGVGERMWKWAALVLGVLVTAGGLLGTFGHAFYVPRFEYTRQTQDEAVSRENMRGTLERLDKTLILQAKAFEALTNEVQGMKIDLAVVKKTH